MTLIDTSDLPEDHPALVPDFWSRTILSAPLVTPHLQKRVLAEAHLPHLGDSDTPLPVTPYHEAFLLERLCLHLNDSYFGALAGMQHSPQGGSILMYISLAAARFEDMLTLLQRYMPITRPKAHLEIERSNNQIILRFGNSDPSLERNAIYVEFATAALLRTFSVGLGRDLCAEVQFAHGGRNLDKLSEILRCPVQLNGVHNQIRFPLTLLDAPLQSNDNQLLKHLTRYGEILLEQRQTMMPSIRGEIEKALVSTLNHKVPTLEEVADFMGLSSRTLSRRLAEDGTSFREVVDTLRCDLACRYMTHPALSLAEIAYLLGFSDQSSFGTAFRRWTGQTPRQYRQTIST